MTAAAIERRELDIVIAFFDNTCVEMAFFAGFLVVDRPALLGHIANILVRKVFCVLVNDYNVRERRGDQRADAQDQAALRLVLGNDALFRRQAEGAGLHDRFVHIVGDEQRDAGFGLAGTFAEAVEVDAVVAEAVADHLPDELVPFFALLCSDEDHVRDAEQVCAGYWNKSVACDAAQLIVKQGIVMLDQVWCFFAPV